MTKKVRTDDGAQFAKENRLAFIETSAFESTNVESAFFTVVECSIKSYNNYIAIHQYV